MKAASAGLSAHLQQRVTTLATLWRVTRTDGAVFRFTDHDRDLVIGGQTYAAQSGFQPSAVQTSAGLAVADLEIEGALESPSITEADLRAGRWDGAFVEVMLCNWADPSQGVMVLRHGTLGEVSTRGATFVAELRGLAQRLNTTRGKTLTPLCRADLGDARCGVDMAPFTHSFTVSTVASPRAFTAAALTQSAGYFAGGTIEWTGGANAGLRMEIKSNGGTGSVELQLPMPYPIGVGDTGVARAGCDKRLVTCRDRFDNVLNFRGEPYVPTLDSMIRGPV